MKKLLFKKELKVIQINSVQQVYLIRILENHATFEKLNETFLRRSLGTFRPLLDR